MASQESVKRLAKNIVGYPQESIPVVSSEDWVKGLRRDPLDAVVGYLLSLFPIIGWLPRYNLGWLTGDVIAGLTVGIVVVPQGMSYALIATLPAEYGLYSSFVGVLIYCFFATSKDVSIGPVAVMSLTVAQIIRHVEQTHPHVWGGPQIATTLAFICGFIVLGIGLLRIGWIVEYIPAPAVSGFMTGSAISIIASQVPGLMGITGFDTRAAPYKVIINTLKGLPRTQKDAAFGLIGLAALYIIRITCDRLGKRYPRRARLFFFLSILRNAFVLVTLTLAAWLYTRHRKSKSGKYPIKILQTVPRGLKHVKQPVIDSELLSVLGAKLPVATIILLLEHIAISKSFGRVNNYKIDPNQELVAIGVTNTVGSCFGAYPATGSFSRSALKSKSGVRTPAAGIVTAVVVIVALYGLTDAFFFIPTAGLSAVIIHAVGDLIAPPSQAYSFWRVSPLEFVIWLAAVLVTVFSSIENGIYTSISASLALLLIRVSHPRAFFLGKVTIPGSSDSSTSREVFVPLKPNGVINPRVDVTPPPPGVIIYRFEESYLYPNASQVNSDLVDYVKANVRRGKDMTNVKASDRPWNDPGPGHNAALSEQAANLAKPDLHAIVLDFSAISQIDTTGVQSLIDSRNEIERWTDHGVEFHFATVLSPWIRRGLVAGGFGIGNPKPGFSPEVAPISRHGGLDNASPSLIAEDDLEVAIAKDKSSISAHSRKKVAADHLPLYSQDTPFFHPDLASAVRAAERGNSAAREPSLDADLKH